METLTATIVVAPPRTLGDVGTPEATTAPEGTPPPDLLGEPLPLAPETTAAATPSPVVQPPVAQLPPPRPVKPTPTPVPQSATTLAEKQPAGTVGGWYDALFALAIAGGVGLSGVLYFVTRERD